MRWVIMRSKRKRKKANVIDRACKGWDGDGRPGSPNYTADFSVTYDLARARADSSCNTSSSLVVLNMRPLKKATIVRMNKMAHVIHMHTASMTWT